MIEPVMIEALRGFYSSGKFRERFAHECPDVTRRQIRKLMDLGMVEAVVVNRGRMASTSYRVTPLGVRVAG
jgi:hypothetical protein